MPPIPNVPTITATVEPGYPSLFRFAVTGMSGAILIDFGDGQDVTVAAAAAEVAHVYQTPGEYTATATAGPDVATVDVTAMGAEAIVTPDELVLLLGLELDEAKRCALLVQLTIAAYLWPVPVPAPVPPPIHSVGLALAARFAAAEVSGSGIVSESIGSYSYRLAAPIAFDSVVVMLGELAEQLEPWAPHRRRVYELNLGGDRSAWPVDWWQRNLDNPEVTA